MRDLARFLATEVLDLTPATIRGAIAGLAFLTLLVAGYLAGADAIRNGIGS